MGLIIVARMIKPFKESLIIIRSQVVIFGQIYHISMDTRIFTVTDVDCVGHDGDSAGRVLFMCAAPSKCRLKCNVEVEDLSSGA